MSETARAAFGAVFQSSVERERALHRRHRELSRHIEETPNNMTLYVLRGELNLDRGERERAIADFESAKALADDIDDAQGWLVLEQVMRDRALYGLQQARREL